MSLIDETYFKGRINLADISDSTDVVTGNTVNNTFIPLYETEYLKRALGYEMYKAFTNALAESPATKWTDLRDGAEYTIGSKTYKWDGLINSDKVSPIANYVYCEYLRAQAIQVRANGTSVNQKQNSTAVSPAQKISSAWQDMNEMNKSLWQFINTNIDDYPEFDSCVIGGFGSMNVFGI